MDISSLNDRGSSKFLGSGFRVLRKIFTEVFQHFWWKSRDIEKRLIGGTVC